MPHGAAQGAAAANDLAEQQQRSSVQMRNRSKVPQSKSKSQFTGYAGDSPLQTSEPKQQAQRVVPGQKGPKGPPLHPWLEYPPNFERAVARKVVFLKKVPAKLLDPLPAELRYTLSRNFGFFTSVFTQFFDKSGVSNVQNSLGLGK